MTTVLQTRGQDIEDTAQEHSNSDMVDVRHIDQHVGARIRERRILMGYTQQQMANLIGVTYQQAHKYEKGINRISAGRLYSIAVALNVPISYFFEGLSPTDSPVTSNRQRMCLEMARNFSSIENEKFQDALSHLARTLSEADT